MATGGDRQLEGKVALITGAVRRIGRATALALAAQGAAIVVNTRSARAETEAVAAEIEALGGQALVQIADVTDEAAVQAMVDATLARFGRLDILVSNAADRKRTPLTAISLAEWHHITRIIVDGAFLCARACLPAMIAAGGGRVVNIGGASAHAGARERAHVVTAKAALVGLTKAIAVSSRIAASRRTASCRARSAAAGHRARREPSSMARARSSAARGRPKRSRP